MINAPLTDDLDQHLRDHPASPLFARLAERLLKIGEVTRAISLCERGLEEFPHYHTGRLIHAKCLAAREDRESALAAVDSVIAAYPGNIILEQLRTGWTMTVTATPTAEVPSVPEVLSVPEDTATPEVQSVTELDAVPEPETVAIPAGVALEREKASHGFIAENRIVSRTLAEIYASQGALDEAVTTYRLLVAGARDNREMYAERLKELEEHLKTNPQSGRVTGE